ncbi:NMT1 domain-containing protein [Durusdinium trenchii]|uniref:NMT1 domain-containing protein n=1 Tax=Durusdinium trenchii TaxID=1381693 RepID=A0ABP0Q6R6_9DINO
MQECCGIQVSKTPSFQEYLQVLADWSSHQWAWMVLDVLPASHMKRYTIRSGLLEKEGLQAQYAPQTPSTTPAVEQVVKSGQADLCQLAVAASFAELERRIFNSQSLHSRSALINAMLCKTRKKAYKESIGIPPFLRLLAVERSLEQTERDGFFLVGRTKDFQWRDLENKEVLVDHLFQPLALMKYACHLQNVDYSKMKVVDAGSSSLFLQTRWNHGDFVHLQGPAAQKLEYEGKGVVVASMGDVIGPEWLKTDVARAFMRAYRQGRAATAQLAAKEVAEVVQPFFSEVDPEVLVSTVAVYQRPGGRREADGRKMGCWDGEVEIPKATYEKLLDAFLYSGVISKRHPYDAAIAAVE